MILISHSNHDAGFVGDLRKQLERLHLETWVDCRELTAGQTLAREIEQAIDDVCYFIAVISPQTVNSLGAQGNQTCLGKATARSKF